MSTGHSPLAQFEVKTLVQFPEVAGLDLSFTNSSLLMVIAVLLASLGFAYGTRSRALVPGRLQSVAELSYEFIADMVQGSAGVKGLQYFPFIFTLFIFLIISNLLGMVPYSFTTTSHLIVTLALAGFIFVAITVIGFVRHGTHFLGLFIPSGVPGWIAPLMFFIELFSYLARPFSLSIRLAANMMAGHTMLKVLAGFVISLGFVGGWLPFSFVTLLIGFEIFVALLQAYIFTILTCVYLNDALNLH